MTDKDYKFTQGFILIPRERESEGRDIVDFANLLGRAFSLSVGGSLGLLLSTDGGKKRHGGGHEGVLQRVLADERVEPANVDLRRSVRWLGDHQRSSVHQGSNVEGYQADCPHEDHILPGERVLQAL